MARMPRITTAIERITHWIGSAPSLILHTAMFIAFFFLSFAGFLSWDLMFLILTTIVSLEAIYLAIFIQMTVNRHGRELVEVSEDVEDIQEDIQEMSEEVEDISEDVEGIQMGIEGIADEENVLTEAPVTLEQLADDIRRIREHLEELRRRS